MAIPMGGTRKSTWKTMNQFFPWVNAGDLDANGLFIAATSGGLKLVAYSASGSQPFKNLTTNTTIYTPPGSGAYVSASPPLATASVNDGDKLGTTGNLSQCAFAGYIGEIPNGLSLYAFASAGGSSPFTIYTASTTTKIYLISFAFYATTSDIFIAQLRKSTGAVLWRSPQKTSGSTQEYSFICTITLMQLGQSPWAVLNASESLQLTIPTNHRLAGLMLYE
jgi:hypothetical protein